MLPQAIAASNAPMRRLQPGTNQRTHRNTRPSGVRSGQRTTLRLTSIRPCRRTHRRPPSPLPQSASAKRRLSGANATMADRTRGGPTSPVRTGAMAATGAVSFSGAMRSFSRCRRPQARPRIVLRFAFDRLPAQGRRSLSCGEAFHHAMACTTTGMKAYSLICLQACMAMQSCMHINGHVQTHECAWYTCM